MAEDLGERTEEPTQRRLSEARERGQVAKSQDFAAAMSLLGATVLVVIFGADVVRVFGVIMNRVLAGDTPGDPLRVESVVPAAQWAYTQAAVTVAPMILLIFIIAYLANFVQVGWLLTAKPLQPKLNRISPLQGFKRLFSRRSLVKSAVNILKLIAVIGVCTIVAVRHGPRIASLARLDAAQGMYMVSLLALELVAWLLLLLLILAVLDLIFQRWQHKQDLKMTKHQVKDERRSFEGDPHTKRRRMEMAQSIAMQRVQRDVPGADVVVTNPTHFSVAIRYEPGSMNAPRVVAKGVDHLAIRIRQIASANAVPIVERPPLARGLYWGVDVGREIPPEFYEAVAEILAYVYRMEQEAAA